MNERITAALANIFDLFDVSAVYAAIIKKSTATSERRVEETLKKNRNTTTTKRSWGDEGEGEFHKIISSCLRRVSIEAYFDHH